MSQPPQPNQREEVVVGYNRNHGKETMRIIDRAGIRLEVAIKVYAEMISQLDRGSRLHEQIMLPTAVKAFKAAEAFLMALDNEP